MKSFYNFFFFLIISIVTVAMAEVVCGGALPC